MLNQPRRALRPTPSPARAAAVLALLLLALPGSAVAWWPGDHEDLSRAAAKAVDAHYGGRLEAMDVTSHAGDGASVQVDTRTCYGDKGLAIRGSTPVEILAQNSGYPDGDIDRFIGDVYSTNNLLVGLLTKCFLRDWETQQFRHAWLLVPIYTPYGTQYLPVWGNAPDQVKHYYDLARDAFSDGQHNRTGLFYLSLASHYIEDMAVPYHVGKSVAGNALHVINTDCDPRWLCSAHDKYEYDVGRDRLYKASDVSVLGRTIPTYASPSDYAKEMAYKAIRQGDELEDGYAKKEGFHWFWEKDESAEGQRILKDTTEYLMEQAALHTAGLYEHLFRSLPNLRVTSAYATSTGVGAALFNSGATTASHVTVRLVTHQCSSPVCIPTSTVAGEQTVTVPAGGSQTVHFPVPPHVPNMRYELVVDPAPLDGRSCGMGGALGCILERDETVGGARVAPEVVPLPLPDLAVSPAGVQLLAGQVRATVQNVGPGDAAGFEVRLYSRPPPSGEPALVTSQWVAAGLAAGQSTTVTLDHGGGLVEPFVRVDETSNVAEVDELGNNQATAPASTWTIQAPLAYTGADLRPGGDVTVAQGGSLSLTSANLWLAPGARLTVEANATLELRHARLAPAQAGQSYTATVHGTLVLEDANVTGVAGGLRFDGPRATVTASRLASVAGAPALAIEGGDAELANNQFLDGEGQGLLLSGDAVVTSLRDTFQGNRGTAIDARGGVLTLNQTRVEGSPTALGLSGGAYVTLKGATLAPGVGPRAPAATVAIQNDGGVLVAIDSTVAAGTALRGHQGALTFHGGSLQGTKLLDGSGSLVVQAHGTATSGTRATLGQSRVKADWPVAIQALSPAPDTFAIPFAKLQVRDAAGALVWNGTADEAGAATLWLPEFTQDAAGATTASYTLQAQHNGAPVTTTFTATAPRSLTVRPQVLADLAVVDVAPGSDGGQSVLWARIRGLEPASATNVTVQFEVDGLPVGQTTLAWVPGSGMMDATVPRPPLPGVHTVTARVDPAGAVAETQRGNNALARQAWVVSGTESCSAARALNGTLQVRAGGRLDLACALTLGGDALRPARIEVQPGATLSLGPGAALSAAPGKPYAIQVEGTLLADRATLAGASGIAAEGGRVQLQASTLEAGVGTLLAARGTTVELRDNTVRGGNLSAALNVVGGAVTLTGNRFTGFGGDVVTLHSLGGGLLAGNRFSGNGAAYTVTNASLTIQDDVIDPTAVHSVVAHLAKLTLLNVTHDFESVWQGQGSRITVAWHVRAGIVGTDGGKGQGVVTVIDRFGQWRQQVPTGGDGWTPDLKLAQFVAEDLSGDGKTDLPTERQAFTPYTLMAGSKQVALAVAGNADGLVPQTYAPQVRAAQPYLEGAPGGTFQFAVEGYDLGNGDDTLSFSLSGATPGWAASVTPATATAPVGGSAPVTVRLTAPNQQGAVGYVDVTATAEDGSVSPALRLSAKTGVNLPPGAFFNAAAGVAHRGDPIQFRDDSRDADGYIDNRTWDFGDGATSHAANPVHAYATLGTKTVRLTVVDNGGAAATATNTVQVVNRPPTLTGAAATPTMATSADTVTYAVTYRDLDGDAPSFVRVVVDGQPHELAATSAASVALGRTYQWQATGLAAGVHKFRFEAGDGQATVAFPNGYDATGPTVNNPPTLTSPSVSPPSGTPSTVFTYRVVYRDTDNDAPQSVNAVVDGTPVAMVREQAGAQAYATGVAYVAQQVLAAGAHTVSFTASDGQGTASTGAQQAQVLGSSPLQGPSASPSTGAPGTQFTFRATYKEASGAAPDTVTLVLDGQSSAMTLESSANGAHTYRGTVPITAPGRHAYAVTATRAGATYRLPDTGTLDGPLVNTAPTARLAAIPAASIDTTFTANGGASTDPETAAASLEAKVDWGDGDRGGWVRQLAQQHHYARPGTYRVTLQVRDLDGAVAQAAADVTVVDAAPVAAYAVTPGVGNAAEGNPLATQFTFNAGASGDLEDPWDALRTRWDWEGDGAWDTDWLPFTGKATHVYPYAGAYAPKLAVKDAQGQVSTVSHPVTVEGVRPLAVGQTALGSLLEAGHRQVWKVVLPEALPGQLPPHNLVATLTWSPAANANLDLFGLQGGVPDPDACSAPCRSATGTQLDVPERVCWGLPAAGTYYLEALARTAPAAPVAYQISLQANVAEARTDLAYCATAGAGERVTASLP